jgi:hypothetical protein
MGAIARNIANKITTSGVFTSGAITNSSVTGITVLANASDGITLISSQTASNSASISFTGLNSTYKAYKFVFVNIHPVSDDAVFSVNFTDGVSNLSKQSTIFRNFHNEADNQTLLDYLSGLDLANSTSNQPLNENAGNGNDEHMSGYLDLFNPASTTYVKHFIGRAMTYQLNNAAFLTSTAGYVNSTSAVTNVIFQMDNGNIDAGTIYLYGIK